MLFCYIMSLFFFIIIISVSCSKQFEAIQREAVTSSTMIGQCLESGSDKCSTALTLLILPQGLWFYTVFLFAVYHSARWKQAHYAATTVTRNSTVSTDWCISASVILFPHQPISFMSYISTKNKRVHSGFVIMKLTIKEDMSFSLSLEKRRVHDKTHVRTRHMQEVTTVDIWFKRWSASTENTPYIQAWSTFECYNSSFSQ